MKCSEGGGTCSNEGKHTWHVRMNRAKTYVYCDLHHNQAVKIVLDLENKGLQAAMEYNDPAPVPKRTQAELDRDAKYHGYRNYADMARDLGLKIQP